MLINFDIEGVRQRAMELEQEVAANADLPEGLRMFYAEKEGKLILDTSIRDEFVAQLTTTIDRENLTAENSRLRKDRDRRLVSDTVRHHMVRIGVKPELMAGAVSLFTAQHKFAVRDGQVVVVGKMGASDAEMATIQWAEEGEGDAFLDKCPEEHGGFMDAIAKLRVIN